MVYRFSPYNRDDRLIYNLKLMFIGKFESEDSYVDKQNLDEQFQLMHFDNHRTLLLHENLRS
jgi:hypothetical protein